MAAIVRIYDPSDGSVQAAADLMGYNYRGRGTGTTVASPRYGNTNPSSLTITLPTNLTLPIVAVRLLGYAAGFLGYQSSKNVYAYASNAPAGTAYEYYIFDRAATSASGKQGGLKLRNPATGELTFDSNIPPMRVLSLLGYTRSGSASLGGSGAATPSAVWPGRKLALAQGGFAGHSFPAQRFTYSVGGGGPILDPGDGTGNFEYAWRIDGKVYGGTLDAAGSTASVGEISFDDVTGARTRDPTEPRSWSVPCNCMFVVDVSGYN